MLLLTLKHYLYDIALNAMFDKILFNFPVKKKYEECNYGALKIGDYILVIDSCYSDDWSKGYVTSTHTNINGTLVVNINVTDGDKILAFNPKCYTIYKIN